MSKYLFLKYLLISKKTGTIRWIIKKLIFGGSIWGGPWGGWYSQTMSKYLSLKCLLILKKTGTLRWTVKKLIFGGVPWGGGGVAKACQNICLSNIYWYPKNWHPSMSRSKVWFFGASFWGVPRRVAPKKFLETQLQMYLNNFTQKLDFYVLWFRRTWAYKIWEEKKEKIRKKPNRGRKWVGRDERIS